MAAGQDFTVRNLPFGVFSRDGDTPHAGMALGEWIVDLAAVAAAGLIDVPTVLVAAPTLNALIAATPERRRVRTQVSSLLTDAGRRTAVEPHLVAAGTATLHLPCAIGRLFRPDEPLLPNYKYVPTGYQAVPRPSGTP